MWGIIPYRIFGIMGSLNAPCLQHVPVLFISIALLETGKDTFKCNLFWVITYFPLRFNKLHNIFYCIKQYICIRTYFIKSFITDCGAVAESFQLKSNKNLRKVQTFSRSLMKTLIYEIRHLLPHHRHFINDYFFHILETMF